jgi:glycosyltransferase involved in cell wall biosynthesis
VIRSCHTYWEKYVGFYFPWLPAKFMQWFVRILLSITYKKDEHLIVPTREFAHALQKAKLGKQFAIVPAGIDENKFSPSAKIGEQVTHSLKNLLGIPTDTKEILLFAGRLGEEKNVHFLIKSFSMIQKKRPSTHLVLAGDGPLKNQLLHEMAHTQEGLNVHLPGYIDYTLMPALYKMCKVLVFPSKTETLGLTTLEAMSCGLPVAAIHAMGSQEILAGDNGGILTDEDPAKFSAAVLALLEDQKLYQEKSAQAVVRAAEWSLPHSVRLLLEFYDKLSDSEYKNTPASMTNAAILSEAPLAESNSNNPPS